MQIKVKNESILDLESDVIIVNLFEGVKIPGGVTGIVDKAFNNIITDYVINKENFEGKYGEIYQLPIPEKNKKILIAGLGKQKDFNKVKIRNLTAKIVKLLKNSDNAKKVVSILHGAGIAGLCPKGCAQMITEGAISGGYEFNKYKSDKKENKIEEFIIAETDEEKFNKAQEGVEMGIVTATAVNEARNLINESAQYLYPETLAQYAVENSGVKTTVYNKEQIKEKGMNAFLAVSQGSIHEPRLIHMEYKNGNPKKKIAIIGKGITFDAGGLDLKPPSSMLTMRDDMSGAAAVITTMKAISELKPEVEVHAIVAACENMPSGSAYKPGDVITAKTGRTIEIDNTDAEGRVTLADALAYAEELGVDEIIDIATLTGACMVALGTVASGIMGNNDEMVNAFISAAEKAGERYWQMPMYDEYGESLSSDIADTKNTGGRMGGTSAAGIFLSKFVKNTPWVHLDIAGTAFAEKATPEGIKGATGVGIRALIKYIMTLNCSGNCGCK
ncbi:MAG: leucyl aminopeptidase [Candidatus Gastranaerophilales bacterium]|nr:leucyl aminopeptidase [Candidatus Gastranaerophilales bacterium]